MQTALHILSLVNELKSEALQGKITGTEVYRKERTAYIFLKKKQRLALAFGYHPVKWGTFLVPASKIKPETPEKPRSLFDIEGAVITGVEQFGLDRIFALTIERDDQTGSLVFEAMGPNGNVLQLDQSGHVVSSMRRKRIDEKQKYKFQPLEGKFNPVGLAVDQLSQALKSHTQIPLAQFIEKNILGFNMTLARETLSRAELKNVYTDDLEARDISSLLESLKQVVAGFQKPEVGYVYGIAGKHEAYPLKLSHADQQPARFKTLSLAVLEASQSRSQAAEQEDEEKTVISAVKRALKRMHKRLVKIEADIREASDYEKYHRFGELLKVNYRNIKKGMASVVLEDAYFGKPQRVEIALDPALSPQENAEAYFKRYRKGREGLALLERRKEISRQELGELTKIAEDLEHNFESARLKYEQEILSLMPSTAEQREVAPRLPYRPFTLSTGLRIFVGRDGADNDRTTFEFARPYELWFHTQQCPGSHVVMKFPNKSFEPSRQEIEETAAVAAWFSKARNDSLVPVVYTQRKYVRKPRKAKPGLVLVEREKSLMVEPARPSEE